MGPVENGAAGKCPDEDDDRMFDEGKAKKDRIV